MQKDLSVDYFAQNPRRVRGEMNLFDDVRYFFYITNDRKRSANQMVHFYRGRSDHENDIDQLKNGINALNPASDTLLSNWALICLAGLGFEGLVWPAALVSSLGVVGGTDGI
jgi:hypothetical protein